MRKRFRQYYTKEHRKLTLLVGTIKNDDGTYTLILPERFVKRDFKTHIITADEFGALSNTIYSILMLHIKQYQEFHYNEFPLAVHIDNIVLSPYNGQAIKWEYIKLNIKVYCDERLSSTLYNKCMEARKAYNERHNIRMTLKNKHKAYVSYCEGGSNYEYYVSKNNLNEAVKRQAIYDGNIKRLLEGIQQCNEIIKDAREHTKKYHSPNKGQFYYYLYLAGKLNEGN